MQFLYAHWPLVLLFVTFGVPIAHRVLWYGFCGLMLVIDREHAAEIIDKAGKWAPKSVPTLPWWRNGPT